MCYVSCRRRKCHLTIVILSIGSNRPCVFMETSVMLFYFGHFRCKIWLQISQIASVNMDSNMSAKISLPHSLSPHPHTSIFGLMGIPVNWWFSHVIYRLYHLNINIAQESSFVLAIVPIQSRCVVFFSFYSMRTWQVNHTAYNPTVFF